MTKEQAKPKRRDDRRLLIAKRIISAQKEMLGKLIEWEVYMGGWESPVWAEARKVYRLTMKGMNDD